MLDLIILMIIFSSLNLSLLLQLSLLCEASPRNRDASAKSKHARGELLPQVPPELSTECKELTGAGKLSFWRGALFNILLAS